MTPDPFISTQNLSDMLGRDVTADNGAMFAVEAACDIVRDVCEQDLTYGTSTIQLDGTGTDVLVLPQFPAANCGTVVLLGSYGGYGYGDYGYYDGYGYGWGGYTGTITDYTLSDNGLLLRGTAGALGFARPKWPAGRQNVQITYEHGYQTIPFSLQAVALQVASRMVVQGVAQAETIGDVTVTYAAAANDLTANELRILAKYNRPQSF
jgi:hypothetical protein